MSEHNVLTVSFKTPQWLKDVWAKINWNWLKSDNMYELFFKLLGIAIVAPLVGGLTTEIYTGSMPAILSTGLVALALLVITFMASVDEPFGTAKAIFWNWLTVVFVWYVTALVGIIEIAVITALVS